jgi:hypothetical protein
MGAALTAQRSASTEVLSRWLMEYRSAPSFLLGVLLGLGYSAYLAERGNWHLRGRSVLKGK